MQKRKIGFYRLIHVLKPKYFILPHEKNDIGRDVPQEYCTRPGKEGFQIVISRYWLWRSGCRVCTLLSGSTYNAHWLLRSKRRHIVVRVPTISQLYKIQQIFRSFYLWLFIMYRCSCSVGTIFLNENSILF